MKTRYKLLLAVLLVWAQVFAFSLTGGGSALFAQDAFYIYRNDGDFNGFFFDEIKRMGVSKFDLDSIEHDIYVVQEIETADSIYRIPLAAIDSIGFQQPEVILNPRLKDFDEIGLTPYITYFQENLFRLDVNTPQNLVPQEGDVLVSFNNPFFRSYGESEENFSGYACKVTNVYRYDDRSVWSIRTTAVTELSDIFLQFISVEQIGYDNEGHARRRIAGFDYDATQRRWVRKGAQGNDGIKLLDFSSTLHHDGSYGSIDLGVKLKAGMDITYNINAWRIYFKLGEYFGVELTPGATVKASRSFEAIVDGIPEALSAIKFPAIAPMFQTRPFPKVFLRGSGDLAAKLTLPTVGYTYHQSLIYDSNKSFPWNFSMFDEMPDDNAGNGNELIDTGDVELSLSGFVQMGTKFLANVETNSWFKKIFQCGINLELFVGPKIEGNVSLSVAKLAQQGAYESLAGTKFTFHPISLDLAAKAYVNLFWHDPEETTFYDASKSFFSQDFYLFPSFNNMEATYNPDSKIVTCSTDAENRLFWKSHAGFAVYNRDEDTLVDTKFPKTFYPLQKAEPYTEVFTDMKAGWYTIMPAVKTLDYLLPVSSQKKDVMVEPYLRVTPHQLDFPAKGGTKTVSLETNAVIAATATSFYETEKHDKSVTVIAPANPSIFPRKEWLYITAFAPLTDAAKDTVTINHAGNNGENIHSVYFAYGESQFIVIDSSNHGSSGAIPCTASRNGDVITVTGSYSHSFYAPETESTPGGNFSHSYSINMRIDTLEGTVSGNAHGLEIRGVNVNEWDEPFSNVPISYGGINCDYYAFDGRIRIEINPTDR